MTIAAHITLNEAMSSRASALGSGACQTPMRLGSLPMRSRPATGISTWLRPIRTKPASDRASSRPRFAVATSGSLRSCKPAGAKLDPGRTYKVEHQPCPDCRRSASLQGDGLHETMRRLVRTMPGPCSLKEGCRLLSGSSRPVCFLGVTGRPGRTGHQEIRLL